MSAGPSRLNNAAMTHVHRPGAAGFDKAKIDVLGKGPQRDTATNEWLTAAACCRSVVAGRCHSAGTPSLQRSEGTLAGAQPRDLAVGAAERRTD